jgi:hypothetical protein
MNNFTFEKTIWNAFAMDDYFYLVNEAICLNGTDSGKINRYMTKFVSFYRVRRHEEKWIKPFFGIFKQALSDNDLSFGKYLDLVKKNCVHNDKHQIEMSFTSKMLHTIRPGKFPILDSRVLSALKIPNNSNAYSALNDAIDKISRECALKHTTEKIRETLAKNLGNNELSEYKVVDIILYFH